MKTKVLLVALILGFAAITVCLPADSKIEQAVRDLDAQWSAAAAAKDVDKTVSYYADDAVVLAPNVAAATTKDAIRKRWKEDIDMMVNGSWKATKVDVAKSGDIAYVTGTYEWTSKDASGNTSTDRGKYLEVFKKQVDGKWKCTADCWNSDLPASAPGPKP
jgi:ketosteroid isomerase-like protein